MFDVVLGFLIVIPMLVGMLGYPFAVWQRLSRRFLTGRGVALWRKLAVAAAALMPALLTLVLFGLLSEFTGLGGDGDRTNRAPRALPIEAYPMALGMLVGVLVLGPFVERITRYLPYFSVPPAPDTHSRSTRTELHPLEQHVKDELTFRPIHQLETIPFAELPVMRQTPPELIAQRYQRFAEHFLQTPLEIVAKRFVSERPVRFSDLRVYAGTLIVAADEDCLRYLPDIARAPLVRMTGAELLELVKPDTSILLQLPGLSVSLYPSDWQHMRSERSS